MNVGLHVVSPNLRLIYSTAHLNLELLGGGKQAIGWLHSTDRAPNPMGQQPWAVAVDMLLG
jgi:hypothetical protein